LKNGAKPERDLGDVAMDNQKNNAKRRDKTAHQA
jgi:hypothetical protein